MNNNKTTLNNNRNINFVSIVRQTFEERYKMYMKCTKKELASMLAENAKYTNPEGCAELQKNNPDPTLESISFSASTMD